MCLSFSIHLGQSLSFSNSQNIFFIFIIIAIKRKIKLQMCRLYSIKFYMSIKKEISNSVNELVKILRISYFIHKMYLH